jgi:formamidopyrimidine-DNA glycosylase
MPELPDLQVFSRNLNKKFAGKKLKEVVVHVEKRLKTPAKELKKTLEGARLKEIMRVGKELHFKFDNGKVLGLHLMLEGNLFAFEGKNENKHSIIELRFEDNSGLVLSDWQKKATPTLDPEPWDAPDALSKEVNLKFIRDRLSGSRATVKSVLLDQHTIRGIGNAYADEILWEAGISPFSISNKIPPEKVKDLATAIKKVLKDAEKQILKTHPDIITGEVRDFLKIHNAKKKESPTGAPIEQKRVSSRKTYFTKEQELFE